MKREKNEKRVEAVGPAMAAVTSGVPISYVKLEPTPGNPTITANASQFIPIDAAPGLDQSIEPTWAGAHTFLKGVGFAPAVGSPSQATLDLSGQSFTYSVTSGTTHDFLVGGKQVGRIDDPQNPGEDDSLVARKYVQDYVTDNVGGGAKPGPPTKAVELKSQDGTADTYMRSDATLALDQGISPGWTGNHAFDNQASFKGGIAFQDGASIDADANGIAYEVDSGKIHEFHVGDQVTGRIDDPQNPAEDDSLVARKYVQDYVTDNVGGGAKPGPPTKAVELKSQDGTADTYMRSDATLALDQGISPGWTGNHTFDNQASFKGGIAFEDGASINVDSRGLAYGVAKGKVHELYVDGQLVGQIDDPQNPSGDSSLISRKYLQKFSTTYDASAGQLLQPVSYMKVTGGGSATVGLPVPDDSTPWSSYVKALFLVDGQGACTLNFDGKDASVQPSTLSVQDKEIVDFIYSSGDSCWYALPINQDSGVSPPPVKRSVDMVVSQGSPKVEKGGNLAPANLVMVYGPSGVNFRITVDNGATIEGDYEPGGNGEFFQIQNGKAQFRLQMPPDSTSFESTVTVVPNVTQDDSVVAALGGLSPVRRTSVFFPMQSPSSDNGQPFIESYAATGNVPADGVAESEIYVMADKTQASEVWMTVTGSATFDDGSQERHIPLAQDGSAVGKVRSTVPGANTVTIKAPDGSNLKDKVNVYPIFVSPPVVG